MNIRKVTLIFVVVILTFLTGCASSSSSASASSQSITKESNGFGFESVYSSRRQRIFREVTTDVLYFYSETSNGGGLAVMLNPETGKPLTYSEWKTNYSN